MMKNLLHRPVGKEDNMATVTNWIDHLSAEEVAGAIYPGVGTEGILVYLSNQGNCF